MTHRGGSSPFADYVAGDPLLDGVLVLHRGAIVFEAYPHMEPWQRHFAWSVSKVITATTLAMLAGAGRVAMDAPVERYLPWLSGTAWAGLHGEYVEYTYQRSYICYIMLHVEKKIEETLLLFTQS